MAGRKPCIDSKIVEDEILKYKNDIVGSNKESKYFKNNNLELKFI